MRALVVEYGVNRGALAGVRALAAAGWEVGVAGSPHVQVTASSRAVSRTYEVPSSEDEDALVTAVARAVREGGYEVVFPVDDGQLLALSRRRDEVGAVLPYAAHVDVARALDKFELARAARAVGLATPAELNADEAALARRSKQVVIKPGSYTMVQENGVGRRIETDVVSGAEAVDCLRVIRAAGAEPLIQEPVEGRLMAVVALIDRDGRIPVMLQQESERIWPARAGVSARARTVPLDAELGARVGDLLRELRWFGMAELQFVRPAGGAPHIIDFNGRFYGSLSLAVAAGANLPQAWALLATDRTAGDLDSPLSGVRYQWLAGDLRWSLSQGGSAAALESLGTMRYGLGAVHGVGELRDPGPLASAAGLKLRAVKKRARAWRLKRSRR
jgi:predicted ATP-grasp superfamily ATP-dependent carboligase